MREGRKRKEERRRERRKRVRWESHKNNVTNGQTETSEKIQR